MGTHSRTLQFNAYWFDGILLEIFGTLIVGETICGLSESGRMDDLAGSIEKIHANTITTLATSVSRLIEPSSVPSLETVRLGGEPVPPSDRDRWASRVKLLSVYGTTETCIILLVGDMTRNSPATLLDNEFAPLGGIGELFIEGPGLARHYLNKEDKSSTSFVSNQSWMVQDHHVQKSRRVYKTGDLVRISPDGTLTWIGHKDSLQVKIRGQRVELAKIGETIRQHIPKPFQLPWKSLRPAPMMRCRYSGHYWGLAALCLEDQAIRWLLTCTSLALIVVDIFKHPILSSMADVVEALDHEEDLLKEGSHDARIVDEKAVYPVYASAPFISSHANLSG
ncbi:hypothetical protein ACHAPU_009063 [Fusarium lateritium]